MEEENKDLQRELVSKITKAANLISEHGRKGGANCLRLSVEHIEELAMQWKVSMPEAIERIRTTFSPVALDTIEKNNSKPQDI